MGAVAIGLVGGALVVLSIGFFDKLKIDDPVSAVSVHLTCGVWGTLAVVLTNEEATIGAQLYGIVVIGLATIVISALVCLVLKIVIGISV